MGRKFDVSLRATSKRYSLAELTALLERPPQSGSHDKDAPHPSGATWKTSIWRENALDPTASLEEQGVQLLNDVCFKCMESSATSAGDVIVTLDIASYFETTYLSLRIPPVLISELSRRGIGLEITAYPVAESKVQV